MNTSIWIGLLNCDEDGVNSGLFSIIPTENCIANSNDYQVYHLLSVTDVNINVAFDSYSSFSDCMDVLLSGDKSSMMQFSFPRECVSGMSSLRVQVFHSFPDINAPDCYIEKYFDSNTCDKLVGYTVVPENKCLRDDSLFIFFRTNDFMLANGKTRKQYASTNETCVGGGTFTEIIPRQTLCRKATDHMKSRLSYGCGLYYTSEILFSQNQLKSSDHIFLLVIICFGIICFPFFVLSLYSCISICKWEIWMPGTSSTSTSSQCDILGGGPEKSTTEDIVA